MAIIGLSILFALFYYASQFRDDSSHLSVEVEEFVPLSVENISSIIEEVGQTPFPSTEQKLNNEQSYSLYEEELPEENYISGSETSDDANTPSRDLPLITIVIDDMGINVKRTKDISSLHYPLTASFLTYANNLKNQIANSQAGGQEIMAHLPMEPQVMQNFTSQMLTTAMSDKEVKQTLKEMLDLFPNIVAVNNHMGSKFTEDKHRMAIVMQELAARNLIFLDSKTTSHSVGAEEAKRFNVRLAERNVFLDNKDDFNYIMGQLRQTEQIARSRGHAIAIGHPKEQTYLALKAWLPTLEEKGLQLVPLSKMVKALQDI